MRSLTANICLMLVVALFGPSTAHGNPSVPRLGPSAGSCRSSQLTVYDAEILLSLLPESRATRKRGGTVAWELQSSTKLNQKDFYIFYVYDLSAPRYGSPTIGYFAVNKHTAQIWDTITDKVVESKDILAVEKILQKAHCIGEKTLATYSQRLPNVLPK